MIVEKERGFSADFVSRVALKDALEACAHDFVFVRNEYSCAYGSKDIETRPGLESGKIRKDLLSMDEMNT